MFQGTEIVDELKHTSWAILKVECSAVYGPDSFLAQVWFCEGEGPQFPPRVLREIESMLEVLFLPDSCPDCAHHLKCYQFSQLIPILLEIVQDTREYQYAEDIRGFAQGMLCGDQLFPWQLEL